MNKKQILSLILIVLFMGVFLYIVMININQNNELIKTYTEAKQACQVDDFNNLCKLCYSGLAGWRY